MEIKLLQENDPLLRQVCEPWDFSVDGDPTELVKAMTKIMFENNGIGLAAPQCGVSKRLFIMGNSDKLFVCINPEILYGEGENRDIEGCLSFPDLWFRVLRNTKIKVRYQNITGEIVEQEFKDLIARVYQHELDHLDGICYDTKVGKTTLEFAQNRRKKRLRKSFN